MNREDKSRKASTSRHEMIRAAKDDGQADATVELSNSVQNSTPNKRSSHMESDLDSFEVLQDSLRGAEFVAGESAEPSSGSSSETDLLDANRVMNSMRLATPDECDIDPHQESLRKRLAAVAFLLGGGLAAFLVWYWISITFTNSPLRLAEREFIGSILVAQGLVVVGLFVSGTWLVWAKNCVSSRLHLSIIELSVFGLPAVLFTLWQYQFITQYARDHNVLPFATGGWVLLMFTYALFIPNSIRRAGAYVAFFAILPASLTMYLVYFHEGCCNAANADTSYVVQMLMQLMLGGTTATVGVAMIGGLRQEASKARELGQYVLLEKIGEGGMGEVYRGEHRLMKRPCAIKLIRPERAGDPKTLARFEREVSATAQLSHWNNVDIYDYGRSEDGTFFYVMEYLPGLTVKDLVERHGPIPTSRAIHLIRQVCFALEEAHSLNLIHRDIKPSNIMVSSRGGIDDVAKLLDFGLAKPLVDSSAIHLTNDQAITGSPRFMSPEQATGERKIDGRSDIYALGCVAYFVLTGRPPFDESQVIRAIMAHVTKMPQSMSTIIAGIDPKLDDLVMRCLEKDPADRFSTVRELREALDECQVDQTWTDQDATEWWENRPPISAVSNATATSAILPANV